MEFIESFFDMFYHIHSLAFLKHLWYNGQAMKNVPKKTED